MSTLSISSPGYSAEVEQLQNNLLALGFYVFIDGYFGPETQQAVEVGVVVAHSRPFLPG